MKKVYHPVHLFWEGEVDDDDDDDEGDDDEGDDDDESSDDDDDIQSQINKMHKKQKYSIPKKNTYYRVQVAGKPTVPPFPPYMNDPPVFLKCDESRRYLLTKLINAERATISSAKSFSQRLEETRKTVLTDLIEQYLKKRKK